MPHGLPFCSSVSHVRPGIPGIVSHCAIRPCVPESRAIFINDVNSWTPSLNRGSEFSGWGPRVCLVNKLPKCFSRTLKFERQGSTQHICQKGWRNRDRHQPYTQGPDTYSRCCQCPVHVPCTLPLSLKMASLCLHDLPLGLPLNLSWDSASVLDRQEVPGN